MKGLCRSLRRKDRGVEVTKPLGESGYQLASIDPSAIPELDTVLKTMHMEQEPCL